MFEIVVFLLNKFIVWLWWIWMELWFENVQTSTINPSEHLKIYLTEWTAEIDGDEDQAHSSYVLQCNVCGLWISQQKDSMWSSLC